jgi:hypothetical protein
VHLLTVFQLLKQESLVRQMMPALQFTNSLLQCVGAVGSCFVSQLPTRVHSELMQCSEGVLQQLILSAALFLVCCSLHC